MTYNDKTYFVSFLKKDSNNNLYSVYLNVFNSIDKVVNVVVNNIGDFESKDRIVRETKHKLDEKLLYEVILFLALRSKSKELYLLFEENMRFNFLNLECPIKEYETSVANNSSGVFYETRTFLRNAIAHGKLMYKKNGGCLNFNFIFDDARRNVLMDDLNNCEKIVFETIRNSVIPLGREDILSLTGYSPRMVSYALASLIDKKLIRRKSPNNSTKSFMYVVNNKINI